MCCLCIQFTHENTSERTILHLVKNKDPPLQGMVACTAKKASYAPGYYWNLVMNKSILRVISPFYNVTLVSNKNRQYFCNHGYTMILLKYC
jgi:hypothetical protein